MTRSITNLRESKRAQKYLRRNNDVEVTKGESIIDIHSKDTINTKIFELSKSLNEKWGEDLRTNNLYQRLEQFILQVEEDDEDLREIILTLTKHFNYYSRTKVNKILSEFYTKIYNDLELVEDRTIYSKIDLKSQIEIDSSNTILEEYKILNQIPNDFALNFALLSQKQLMQIENVIIFDDIIGSGKTLITFLTENIEKIRGTRIKVYMFCFVILEGALNKVNQFVIENNINVEIFYHSIQSKAFKKNYIFNEPGDNINERKVGLHELSRKMQYVLGYNNSQALVAFYRNTPNNTLPTFWWKSNRWEGLFPRDNRKPAFMIKRTNKKSPAAYNLSKKESDKQ